MVMSDVAHMFTVTTEKEDGDSKLQRERRRYLTELTEGCSVECGQVLRDAFPAGDYCFALPVSDEHQVGLLPPHLQILLFVPKI